MAALLCLTSQALLANPAGCCGHNFCQLDMHGPLIYSPAHFSP